MWAAYSDSSMGDQVPTPQDASARVAATSSPSPGATSADGRSRVPSEPATMATWYEYGVPEGASSPDPSFTRRATITLTRTGRGTPSTGDSGGESPDSLFQIQ